MKRKKKKQINYIFTYHNDLIYTIMRIASMFFVLLLFILICGIIEIILRLLGLSMQLNGWLCIVAFIGSSIASTVIVYKIFFRFFHMFMLNGEGHIHKDSVTILLKFKKIKIPFSKIKNIQYLEQCRYGKVRIPRRLCIKLARKQYLIYENCGVERFYEALFQGYTAFMANQKE